MSHDGVSVPATMRFSNEFTLLDIKYDGGVAQAPDVEKVKAAVNPLLEQLRQASPFFGRWKLGESRPIEFQAPNLGGPSLAIRGSTKLLRIVLIGGRTTCEFQFEGTGDGKLGQGPIHMIMKGQAFRDVATGLPIGQSGIGHADVSVQGKALRVEVRTEEVLDVDQSRF